MSILTDIQNELKVPKKRTNSFGGFKYRSCEDIVEAVKPLLKKYEATLTISDTVEEIGERIYVKATAEFNCKDESARVTAYAREAEEKRGMDEADHIICVSNLTRQTVIDKYGQDPNKVTTVHNAVEPLDNPDEFVKHPRKDKLVTF